MDMGNTPNGPHQPHQQHQQSIHHINDFDDYTNLISNPTCVIKFTAEWCGPCKAIAPIYEKLADEHHEKITFIEINVDTAKQITNYEDVKSIPCFKFYYNKVKLDTIGFTNCNNETLIDNRETFISTMSDVQGLQELQEAEGAQESSESIKSDENNEYGEDIDVPIEKVNQ